MGSTVDELERLRGVKQRAVALAASQLEALDVFYLAGDIQPLSSLADGPGSVSGFGSVVPPAGEGRDGTARASLASTAACVRSLLVCPQVKPPNTDFTGLVGHIVDRHRSGELSTYGLEHLNVFTLGQLLPVLADMAGPEQEPAVRDLIDEAVGRLRSEVAKDGVAIAMRGDPGDLAVRMRPHGYLTYWSLSALAAWGQHEGDFASPSLRWSETELYRQIALFQTGHDERCDAYQLGYNLLIQYRFNRFQLGQSLVELGLRTLFGAQLERGVWEKRDPIFRYGDHGEAYCFSFELLTSLLEELRDDWSLLVACEDHLERAMDWAWRNALRQNGPPLWRSAHLVEDKTPESWATAEVYSFLQLYASYLSWRIQSIVRQEFRSFPAHDADPAAFDGLYQPEVRPPAGEPLLLGDMLRESLLEPLRVPGTDSYSLVRNADPKSRVRSAILFGPPGTGKTTYVQRVAEYLGWPLVVLDPSVFAEEGLPLIATVASRVFAKLVELEDTVIFFDEMEALMHSRTDNGGSFEQKFLTTSLLPKLQELADRAACVFFVATNHFETMDRAVQRPGRFDLRLQIMPPSYEEKLRLARERLGPDAYRDLESDLRRQPYHDNIRLASRSEMVTMIGELQRDPDRAEQILSSFRAELMDDDRFREADTVHVV